MSAWSIWISVPTLTSSFAVHQVPLQRLATRAASSRHRKLTWHAEPRKGPKGQKVKQRAQVEPSSSVKAVFWTKWIWFLSGRLTCLVLTPQLQLHSPPLMQTVLLHAKRRESEVRPRLVLNESSLETSWQVLWLFCLKCVGLDESWLLDYLSVRLMNNFISKTISSSLWRMTFGRVLLTSNWWGTGSVHQGCEDAWQRTTLLTLGCNGFVSFIPPALVFPIVSFSSSNVNFTIVSLTWFFASSWVWRVVSWRKFRRILIWLKHSWTLVYAARGYLN